MLLYTYKLIDCNLLKAPFEDIIRNYEHVIFVSEGLKNVLIYRVLHDTYDLRPGRNLDRATSVVTVSSGGRHVRQTNG